MAKSTKAKGQPEQVKGKGKKAENKSVSPAIANAPVVGSEVSSYAKKILSEIVSMKPDTTALKNAGFNDKQIENIVQQSVSDRNISALYNILNSVSVNRKRVAIA